MRLASLEAYPKCIKEDDALEKEPAGPKRVKCLTSKNEFLGQPANQEQAVWLLLRDICQGQQVLWLMQSFCSPKNQFMGLPPGKGLVHENGIWHVSPRLATRQVGLRLP